MIDTKLVMDPAASPARPGVRRVNNVPVAILGGAVAVFLAIMAYVAAGRAAQRQEAQEQPPVRSALMLAKDVTGDYEAGMVPAAGSADSQKIAVQAIPLASAGGGRFPPPPAPPRLTGGSSDSVLFAPQSADSPPADRGPTTSTARGPDDKEDGRDIERMKLEMFKQALRAKTTTAMSDTSETGAPPDAPGRSSDGPRSTDEAAAYVDKLQQLRAAGILPDRETEERGRGGHTDAYARYAGDKDHDRWALGSRLQAPDSPFELRSGAVIPATLQTGINSDLPGQITAIVAQDVRDTAVGKYVLIPQASRLVGTYGSDVKFGQARVLVAWQRIIWPDGKALDIGAMPGADGAGYAGFEDQVDNHFDRLFGGALLLSAITAGISLSQGAQPYGTVSVGGTMAQALGQQLGQVSMEVVRKQMNVAPTIKIRPGYRFNVEVTKDLTFHGPYRAFDYQRSITAGVEMFRQQQAGAP